MIASIADANREAKSLKAAGRQDEALALHRQIVAAFPDNVIAKHNLAVAMGDLGRWTEAEAILSEAMAGGLDAPEAWLVRARCMQALGRLDEAEQAYEEAIRRRQSLLMAQRELVQLRWMRSGDIASALRSLNDALQASPNDPTLSVLKAQALTEAGEASAALAVLSPAAEAAPDHGELVTVLAQTTQAAGETDAALRHARRALALAPNLTAAHAVLVEALLAAGELAQASEAAATYRRGAPLDQHAIALQATAWRLLGDARYRQLYDYDAFVFVTSLETPQGWPSLDAYLADLAGALHTAHLFQTHPFAQSIRHGSQAPNINQIDHPATKALPQVLDVPIRRYLEALGQGAEPLRARNTSRYQFQGMWSIRMRGGGRHVNHVHPQGWISSACYVEVPRQLEGRDGWIKFGEPGVVTKPPLKAERYVEPIVGRLVLFPSYMWHGTVPFAGDDARLTFAFDLVPA